ncbi:substrate-binding periplasmic protein [Pseudoalteromonas phenolica]|uniref:substrate-binding periplasmic protein n=1 Tax=Pseudoalteromonas phenolica TaxID=161398 RepID=UPI001470115D|nr:transporter substrate-binding domain-containing protein [Pseudoalteromonas phenolica]
MKQFKYISLFLLLSLFSNLSASANNLTLSVGEWPPYMGSDLPNNGAIAEIITEAFADIGYQVSFEFYPWARAMEQAQLGRVDGTGLWLKTESRDSEFYFSEPVLEEKHVFFYNKTKKPNLDSFEALKSYSYVGLEDFSYGVDLDNIIRAKQINMYRVSNDEQAFGMLLKNRVSIYPQEMAVGYYLLREHFSEQDMKSIGHIEQPFMRKNSHIILSKSDKNNADILKMFDEALLRMKQSGRYDQLLAKVIKF